MPNLTQIDVSTTGNAVLLALVVFAALGLSYFTYRRTVPPVADAVRYLLMGLRALALILVLLLLFEPILSLTRTEKVKPVVAVLIDDSASMGLVDQRVDRAAQVREILRTSLFREPPDALDLDFLRFSHTLSDALDAPPDSLAFSGDGTDIQAALVELQERMAERYFAGVVVISDGANNLGVNPARYAGTYGVPIYTVGIGDPSEQKDVLVASYVTNEVVYASVKTPVEVYIKSSGFEGRKIPVNLIHDGKTVDTKMVTLTGKGFEQRVRLKFTPQEPGLSRYEIRLPTLEGELTDQNNDKTFYVKVLKSKLKLLLVAGGPSLDLAFLKRALEAEENIELTTYVEKGQGVFYQGRALPAEDRLRDFDAILLVDFPRRSTSSQALDRLRSALAHGTPALFVFSKQMDVNKLWQLKDFLPLETRPQMSREQLVYLQIQPQGLLHPLFRVSEDEQENRQRWQALPPVFSSLTGVRVKDSAQVLAAANLQRSNLVRRQTLPLIVAGSRAPRKSLAVLAYGVWRWDFLMWGIGEDNQTFRQFLKNTIRWLTTETDSKLVRITSNKGIYRSGEEVKFTAQVYHKDYLPINDAEVVVQIEGGDQRHEVKLAALGDGRYEGQVQVLEGGDYEYRGAAHVGGRVLGRDQGKFSVEQFSLEFQNTRMNADLLKRIADESGGTFYTPANVEELSAHLDFPQRSLVKTREWEVWNKAPVLFICIVLFGVEWFIRKRKGML